MRVNRVGNSRHPDVVVRDPIIGVDEYNELNLDPAISPAPEAPLPEALDRYDAGSHTALERLKKGRHRIKKNTLQEFIYTPQILGFINTSEKTTFVPWGCIALRTEEMLHRSQDSFVSDSEIRKEITEELNTPDIREVVWIENAGIIEAGSGLCGTVAMPFENPIGLNVAMNFGFDATGLLVYRIIKPCALTLEQDAHDALKGLRFELPWDISSARELSKGQEIQIVGKAKVATFEGIIAYEGLSLPGFLGVATPGAGIYPVADQERSREYSLKVLALDGKGAVRVTIEKIHAKTAGFTLKLMAGLISPTNNAVPQLGAGVLSYILQTAIENPLQNMLMNTWTVSINANLSIQSKDEILYCFDLDLNNPRHHEAYKNLVKLDVRLATKLAKDSSSGVSKVEWSENKTRVKRGLDFKAFAEKLFLLEASNAKRSGKLTRPDSSEIAYCDKIYRKKFLNIFTGQKDIRWQSIQLKEKDKEPEYYYAFSYEQLNRTPRRQQISRFFSFAKALDICSEVETHSELIKISKAKKLLSSKDDINTSVKIYFTQSGIEKIMKANAEEGIRAFLKHKSFSNPRYALFPLSNKLYNLALIQFELYYYYKHRGSTFRRPPDRLKKIRKAKKIHTLKAEYQKNFGREFKADFELYLEARKFGLLIEKWQHARDKHNVAKFFTRIGRSQSFHYEDLILILADLAGRENVLVHSLSMIGGGISIKSIDEGKITHPRDEAWELINRAVHKKS